MRAGKSEKRRWSVSESASVLQHCLQLAQGVTLEKKTINRNARAENGPQLEVKKDTRHRERERARNKTRNTFIA